MRDLPEIHEAFRGIGQAERERNDLYFRLFERLSEELIGRIVAAVQAAMCERSAPSRGLLLKKELADRLQVSVSTISKMQTEGLPTIQFGKAVRFDYEEALAWVKSRRDGERGERKLRMVA